jgi:hypothetical protein
MRLLSAAISSLQQFLNDRKTKKRRVKTLEGLTGEEKGYLAPFIYGGKNTIYVGLDDGVMGGLVSKKICYHAAQEFDVLEGMAFNLQPWAREHLEKRPELLEGASGEPLTPQEKMRSKGW